MGVKKVLKSKASLRLYQFDWLCYQTAGFYDLTAVWRFILDFDIKEDFFFEVGFYKIREFVKLMDIVTKEEVHSHYFY